MSYASDALIDALERENARLREKIKALTELANIGKLTASQCTELAEENANLRELIESVLYLYERSPRMWENSHSYWKAWVKRAYELGIEP